MAKLLKKIKKSIFREDGFRRLNCYIDMIENGQPYAAEMIVRVEREMNESGISEEQRKLVMKAILIEFGDYAMRVNSNTNEVDLRAASRAFELCLITNIAINRAHLSLKHKYSKEELLKISVPQKALGIFKRYGYDDNFVVSQRESWGINGSVA